MVISGNGEETSMVSHESMEPWRDEEGAEGREMQLEEQVGPVSLHFI